MLLVLLALVVLVLPPDVSCRCVRPPFVEHLVHQTSFSCVHRALLLAEAYEDSSEGAAATLEAGGPPRLRGLAEGVKAPERRSHLYCVYSCLCFLRARSLTLTPRCQSSCFQFHGSFLVHHNPLAK